MRTLAPLLLGIAAVSFAGYGTSLAKRARPPETEICNKSKAKQYVATMGYAGRGHQTTSGWTFIEPGKCRTFREDRYFIRGKARVNGLDNDDKRRGCVKNTKRFDITADGGEIGDEKRCAAEDGYVVDFRAPQPDNRRKTKPVVIR